MRLKPSARLVHVIHASILHRMDWEKDSKRWAGIRKPRPLWGTKLLLNRTIPII